MRLPPWPEPRRRSDGLTIASRAEQRLAWALVAVATLWFAAAACWELFGPILAGHYASMASMGIIADNMLRWEIAAPVWEYTAAVPSPAQYYCHHPWGIFWTTTALVKLLGRHDYVCRLPAVLLSIATPALLYALGRAIWRPIAGALAACAFVVLPISLAFANFNALEVPVIAWSTLGLWGMVRYRQAWRRRHLWASVAGFALALNADWPAFVLLAVVLGFDVVFGFALPKPFEAVRSGRFVRHWALLVVVALATLGVYYALFQSAGKLEDLFGSYRMRSAGADAPLSSVLAERRYWLELMFTPIAMGVGALGLMVCVLRLAWRRRRAELVPLAVFVMASVQYLVFKQGADIHIYWPHYFAPFFALAVAALAATALDLARLRGGEAGGARLAWTSALALALLAAIARDGVAVLPYARATGGRFNEKGVLIESDGDKTAVLRWLAPRLPADASIALDRSMNGTWAQVYSLGGRVVRPHAPFAPTASDVFVVDSRRVADAALARLASEHHVTAVGPVWIVRRGEPPAPIDALRIDEREPSRWEWYLMSGSEPVRSVAADPWATWELRTLFGQPADAPSDTPSGLEQQRIAHNSAVERGDEDARAVLEATLRASVHAPTVGFEDGCELVGVRFDDGVAPTLTLLFRLSRPAEVDWVPVLRSRVIERAPLSVTMADPVVREVGVGPSPAPIRWRVGQVYAWRVPIQKRPGREIFELYRRARPPARDVLPPPDGGGPPLVLDLL